MTTLSVPLATSKVATTTTMVEHESASIWHLIEQRTSAFSVYLNHATTLRKRAFLSRHEWLDKEFREGYLEGAVEQGVAWQIRSNRQARRLSQDDLANAIGTNQSAISRAEDPEYGAHSLDTLTKIAHAFDCALSVKFVPYSQLAIDSEDLSPEALYARSFTEELKIYIEQGKYNAISKE